MRAFVVLLAVAACTPSPPHATAADAERANVALAELEQGRTIIVGKCGGCHKPPLPTEAWAPVFDDMAQRAKLDDSQRVLARQYLTVMATK